MLTRGLFATVMMLGLSGPVAAQDTALSERANIKQSNIATKRRGKQLSVRAEAERER